MDSWMAFAKARPIQIFAAILLLAALADWPYGYYTFLRLVVCLAAAFLAWQSFQAKRPPWGFAMTAIALLFNPFFLVHFHRHQWAWIDVLAAVAFLAFPPVPRLPAPDR